MPPTAGAVLADRYALERPLGQGTFGTTWLARELAGERKVAIKSLELRGLGEWKPVELFEREARVLRSLDHPGVVDFIDAFDEAEPDGGHRFYIVSEYIEGSTLGQAIAGGRRFRAEEATALFTDLLRTLEYLHSLSPRVIHRDIKPDNIVLRPDGRPVLVDFGSVRELAARRPDGGLTIAGTAGFMAPEQAMGVADVRSDLYGLAATLAHAFTHVHPSELPRSGLRPRLGDLMGGEPRLARLLEQMLEPDPDRRPSSAAEVLRRLAGPESAALAPVLPTAVASRAIDPEHALARLTAGPRALVPEVAQRLNFARSTSSPAGAAALASLAFFAGVVLLALKALPLALLCIVAGVVGSFVIPKRRIARAHRLYESGSVARGTVTAAETQGPGGLRVDYTFVHADTSHRGRLTSRDPLLVRHVEHGGPVFVFFDPATPQHNVALFGHELPAALRSEE